MNHRCVALIFLLLPIVALARDYQSILLSKDQSNVVITTSDGSHFDAPKLPDQTGFDQPRISPDGAYAGWLALFPNCCTSYPISLQLVVLDRSQQLHTFDGIRLAIFSWCFLPHSASVAYAQSVLHGSNFRHFELRAISDERLLAEYEFPHEEAENALARKNAPSWTSCVPDT